MTNLEEALDGIFTQFISILQPMIADSQIKSIEQGAKTRGAPEMPHLKLFFGPIIVDNTTMGSIGNKESWIAEVRLISNVKELDEPKDGFISAVTLISNARKLLMAQRQLGLETIVRRVDSKSIDLVPFGYGQKGTVYSAGAIFRVVFVIDNL